jgi:hypothetical protein
VGRIRYPHLTEHQRAGDTVFYIFGITLSGINTSLLIYSYSLDYRNGIDGVIYKTNR